MTSIDPATNLTNKSKQMCNLLLAHHLLYAEMFLIKYKEISNHSSNNGFVMFCQYTFLRETMQTMQTKLNTKMEKPTETFF
jgi:hypothetical protein